LSSVEEIVTKLRNLYCDEIVENNKQIKYIADVLDIEEGNIDGSKSFSPGTAYSYNNNNQPTYGHGSPMGFQSSYEDREYNSFDDYWKERGYGGNAATPAISSVKAETKPLTDPIEILDDKSEMDDVSSTKVSFSEEDFIFIDELAGQLGMTAILEIDGTVTLEESAHVYQTFSDVSAALDWASEKLGEKYEDVKS
jgi:hypothetical protein